MSSIDFPLAPVQRMEYPSPPSLAVVYAPAFLKRGANHPVIFWASVCTQYAHQTRRECGNDVQRKVVRDSRIKKLRSDLNGGRFSSNMVRRSFHHHRKA